MMTTTGAFHHLQGREKSRSLSDGSPQPAHATARRRPRRDLARVGDVHAGIGLDERVVEVLLGVLDEDLDAPLGEAVQEEERAHGRDEVVVLHPRELPHREEPLI